ncbi:MAG: EAL domain-containing protein [Methylococcales bacterium]|nr:EAL domain-containing protein [Methylococcales bacterium]
MLSVFALKLGVAAALVFFIPFYMFIALYSQQKNIRLFLILTLIFSSVLMVANFIMPYSLRFNTFDGFSSFTFSWGETMYNIEGQQSPFRMIVTVYVLGLLLWSLYRIRLFFQQGNKRLGWSFAVFLVTLIVTTSYGAAVDAGLFQGVYVGGFSLLILTVLMSINLALDTKDQSEKITVQSHKLAQARENQTESDSEITRLAQVVRQSPLPLQMLNLAGEVIDVNDASEVFWFKDISAQKINMLQLLGHLFPSHNFSADHLLFKGFHRYPPVRLDSIEKDKRLGLTHEGWIQFSTFTLLDDNQKVSHVIVTHEDVTQQQYNQMAFETISKGVSSAEGQDFFHGLVINLARLFDAKYAFVGTIINKGDSIRTLAICESGKMIDNFTYDLADTPCANVVGQKTCSYLKGVQDLFTKDLLLQKMSIEGYIGSPIYILDNKPIGLIVVMDTKPLQVTDQSAHALEIFAARSGAEIQRNRAEERVRRMAYFDNITQLPNRAALFECIESLLQNSALTTPDYTLYLIDMDNFKNINDALGHDVGDSVLLAVSKRLRRQFGDSVFLARFGGDEFVLIHESEPEVATILSEINDVLTEPVTLDDHIIDIDATLGVVSFPAANDSLLDIVRHAELALYQAKKNGRGTSFVYQESLDVKVQEHINMTHALKGAIAANRLQLYYQPQVKADGTLYGAEVLLRWIDDELGFVSPAKFIPLAEDTGLIHGIGEFVLTRGIQNVKDWLANGVNFTGHLSINVSALQFALPDFAEHVIELVRAQGVDPCYIMLEVTETGLLDNINDTIKKLEVLRAYGITIALDDFGTGYSSLSYLRSLPLDLLKIDKAFIDELLQSDKPSLTESIISIGTHMGLDVIAEGVEHLSQADKLTNMGCGIFQGYYYAKPMPHDDFVAWLGDR